MLNSNKKQLPERFMRLAGLTLTFIFCLSSLAAPFSAHALSPEQKALYGKNILYYDINACDSLNQPETQDESSADGGALYMLGDSITQRSKDQLEAKFKAKEFKPYINASVNRSIKTPGITDGFKTSGLAAAKGDKARIDNSAVVIIALGTNPEDGFETAIKDLVSDIKSYDKDNSGLKIYWVNVFSTGGNSDKKKSNEAIEAQADSQGYTVIDTSREDITLDKDKLHPSIPEGTNQFSGAVVQGLSGQDPSSASSLPASCVCGVGTEPGETTLVGSDNAEKIFNYLVRSGLKPFQAAGIMGNMQVESGLNPRALQPGTTGDFPIAGRGYGLVQWTFPARQDPLIEKARKANKKVYDLQIQLEYVLDELKGSHKSAGDALKKTTNVEQATLIIETQYEIHAGGLQPERIKIAKSFLTLFGSGSSGVPGATGAEVASVSCEDSQPQSDNGGGAVAFNGSAQDAAKSLLKNSAIKIFDDRDLLQRVANGQPSPLDPNLVKLLAALAQKHSFGISSMYRGPCSGSNHCVGKAADINPTIDGQTISYSTNNAKIQKFIDDAAKLQGKNCENGLPNEAYVAKTKANGSKCQVFLDIGSGPHIHLAVSS